MSIPAYVRHIALTVLFLLATVNFAKTTLNVIESSKRLDKTEDAITALEAEKALLEEELGYKKSEEYVEQEARNKLGLAKPGEEVFVPSEVLSSASHNFEASVPSEDFSNLQLWLNLFF